MTKDEEILEAYRNAEVDVVVAEATDEEIAAAVDEIAAERDGENRKGE